MELRFKCKTQPKIKINNNDGEIEYNFIMYLDYVPVDDVAAATTVGCCPNVYVFALLLSSFHYFGRSSSQMKPNIYFYIHTHNNAHCTHM